MIAYTKYFALIRGVQGPTTSIRLKDKQGPLTGTLKEVTRYIDGNGRSKQIKTTLGNTLSGNTKMTTKLQKGSLVDRFKWNTGRDSIRPEGSKLTFGSKAKIGTAAVGTGLLAGKLTGNIAKRKAEQSAISKGLKPGTPEYNEYVRSKEKLGRLSGRAIGGLAGGLGMRYLGGNKYKLVGK